MINRKSDALWDGDRKMGKVKLGSGAFEGAYSFGTRFEGAPGTNPEELLGAAHAACFSMALSSSLAKAGHAAKRIATTATVHLDKVGDGFTITGITLDTTADVPGVNDADLQRHAEETKTGCIVSRALASVPMTVRVTRA